MTDPAPFDDPGPLVPRPAGRARRIATVAVLVALIVSIVFLAFVSGRGLISPAPVAPDRPGPTLPEAAGSARPPSTPPARLAIVDADGRLTTSDAAGHASAPLGTPGVSYSFPTWSPTGDRIAVIGGDAGSSAVDVFAIGPDGAPTGGPSAVYDSADEPPFYVYWSPDGTRLTFLTTEPGGGIALRVAPADASAPAQLVRQGAPMYWAWTGRDRLLVHSGDGADAFVGEVGLDGVPVEPGVAGSGAFRTPAITADGAFRGYVAPGGATADQVVVEATTGSGRHAVDVDGAAALDFSPTEPDLAFIAPDSPSATAELPIGPLRLLSATTGVVRVVLAGQVVAFFWSPDGLTIAALEIGQPSDDKVAGIDRPAIARLASAPLAAAAPGIPLRLVFIDSASGAIRASRTIQLADLFAAQQLPYFDQYALSHRTWSPDGRSIALPLDAADGTSGIEIIPADGTDTTRVADGVAAAWSP